MSDLKQSQFTAITTLSPNDYIPVFGGGTNEKILKSDLFSQINDEIGVYIYPNVTQLQSANLPADVDFPTYVRVESTGYRLYKITSLAAGASDISLSNGTTASLQLENSKVETVATFAALASTPATAGQIVATKGYLAPNLALLTPYIGGGDHIAILGTPAAGNGTQIASATAGVYWQRLFLDGRVSVYDFGAVPNGNITAALQIAVDSSPGTFTISTAYIYEPSWIIDIPYGNFTLSARILVAKNNIIIRGAGMFNTNIKGPVTAQMNEMIRFRGAYACGLLNLTLDGGLPFVVTGAETYGVDIPLVTDQCAHFQLDQVNLANYRVRGWQAIHLWESNIGEVRMFNGGYFAVAAGTTPYGLAFDGFRKEEMTFSGSESNQVYISKLAISCPGGVVSFDSPCFNIKINHIVAEGRTYSWLPLGMGTAKFRYSGLSSLCVIDQAWCYFHEQTAACSAALIDGVNAGPACSLDKVFVYQELTNVANFPEVTDIFRTTSASPIVANVSIQDVGGVGGLTNLFVAASTGSIITGALEYRNLTVRTISNFMGALGTTNFMGKVTFSVGAFGAAQPAVYNFKANEKDVSTIDGSGIFDEYKCRAWVKFNGVTAAIIGAARNVSGVVRNAAGNYTVTFTQAMPDSDYVALPTSNASATGAERAYTGGQAAANVNVINAAGAVLADSTVITLAVFR